jgi:hypothetical protein
VNAERNWRVGHEGRDSVYYEEFHHGAWRRLAIEGEMLGGRPHHVIYFGSIAAWSGHPEWARARRDEIIARIKSALAIPDYDYEGEGVLDAHDRELLIEAAGGLSAEQCGWAGCTERALRGKRLCVTHLYPNAW